MSSSKASQTIDDILSVAQQITSIGKDASSPIPGLPAAFSALNVLIGMVIQVRGNEEKRKGLAENIKHLAEIIESTRQDAANIGSEAGVGTHGWSVNSPELENRVNDLIRRLNDINSDATKLTQSRTRRFIKGKSNADMLVKMRQDVDSAIKNFSFQGQIKIEQLLNGVVEELAANALKSLPHVNSGYSSIHNPTRSGVLPGTRTNLLEDMIEWTRGADPSGNDPLIYILSGGAGTGKSTLAYEMCKRLDETKPKSLGASFFFVRNVNKLSTARYVLPTLAFQLAASQPQLRPHLVAAARKYTNQGKEGQHLDLDLEALIIEPLKKVPSSHHRVIIVIDALDECQKSAQNDVVHLLYLLMRQIPNLPFKLRVLVTTRPEMHIQKALDSVDFRNISKPFGMWDIPKTIADADIRLYLQVNLGKTSQHILEARPTLIDDLTRHAEGLFIYAATLVHFLEDDPFQPLETLDALLSNNLTDAAFSLGRLDRLYLTVLQNAFSEDDLKSLKIRRNIIKVLGSLALVQDRVSANMLKDLTGISTEDTEYVLKRLGSVIHMPKGEDGSMNRDAEIQMLHASFPQFIIEKDRCTNDVFYIDPVEHHTRLASDCLSTMTMNPALTKNICKVDNPFLFMEDIPGLPGVIKKCIPAHLQYTCVHWATHLRNSRPAPRLLELVERFAKKKLTHWIEVLGYINHLRNGVIALIVAYEWWKEKVLQRVKEDVPQIMKDAYRLVLEFFLPISIRPLEIYNSASIFAPHCKMTELYADNEAMNGNCAAVKLVSARNITWGTCLRVIETEKSNVFCVEYSPDGGLIASGSSDGYVQIWDSGVGTLKNTLLGHTDLVRSIAWSPDGEWITSGSDDKTWRVWDIGSGAEVNRQEMDELLLTVAWHENGKEIASVDSGGFQVWDVEIGKAVKLVRKIHNIKYVMAISKDFVHVLDTIDLKTLRLWDTESGTIVRTMKGDMDAVYSAAFLNDTQFFSCGQNGIFVWDIATRNCVHSFRVLSQYISVSQQGDRIAVTNSYGGIIHILDWHTWQECGKLSAWGWNLSLSPNGERLVSALNSNLQLWDLTQLTSETQTTQTETLNVIFSPIHCYIAIVTEEIITIWSPKPYSGEPFCILRGSFSKHAAFSPNAEKFALIDSDKRICVWRIATTPPTLLYTTSRAFGWKGITWSLDGCWIASMITHNAHYVQVCVLDAATGRLKKELVVPRGHYDFPLEFFLDSTMIYVPCYGDAFLYNLKEERQVDVGTFKWETNNDADESKFLEENGWVIRKENRKKLCWIPPSRRYTYGYHDSKIAMWQGHNYFGIVSDSGQLTLLHIPDGL